MTNWGGQILHQTAWHQDKLNWEGPKNSFIDYCKRFYPFSWGKPNSLEDKIPTWINEVAKTLKNVKIDGVTWGTLGPLRKIVAKSKFFLDTKWKT